MSAIVRWLVRILLAASSLAHLARALGGRLAARLPQSFDEGGPSHGAEPQRLGDPVGVVRGRLALRSEVGGSPRLERDLALVGGLLVVGAVAGYAVTAALGGATGTPAPIAGVASPTATLGTAAPSAIAATPPLTGGSASPDLPIASSPPPSVAPTISPALPTPGTPSARLSTVIGRGGLPLLEIRWAAVEGASYELALADLADGRWQRVRLERPTEARVLLAVAADRAYRARVRAVTESGASGWEESHGFALTVIDDASSSVVYEGAWATAGHPLYEEGGAQYARAAGATATLRFVGRSLAWRGPVGPGRGAASLLVDGERVARVDAYASTFQARRILYVRSWAEAAEHRLEIVVSGTPGRPLLAIDAFYVLETVAE